MPELLLIRPPLPPIAAEIAVLPEPASVSVLPPLVTLLPEIVSRLDELFVQVWAAPKTSGAVMFTGPAPASTVMPPP